MVANDNLVIEGADVRFRNFAGMERPFNSEGDRNFCVFLTREMSDLLRRGGWNVKTLKPRNEDEDGQDGQDYIQVSVNYKKGRPPRIVFISSKGRVDAGADEIDILDYADVKQWDVIINPYHWDVNGNTGVKAYLKSLFVVMNEDELELKYADLQDATPRKQSQVDVDEDD